MLEIHQSLLSSTAMKAAATIDGTVPDKPGFYCILVKDALCLPPFYAAILEKRQSKVIYMGLASTSLKNRFLGNELRGKGHGTFFRSLGAVLGYRPPYGSLKTQRNKRNFKFSPADRDSIVAWINQNLMVNWVVYTGTLETIETTLIQHYTPLLNLSKNPASLAQLKAARQQCVAIANGNEY